MPLGGLILLPVALQCVDARRDGRKYLHYARLTTISNRSYVEDNKTVVQCFKNTGEVTACSSLPKSGKLHKTTLKTPLTSRQVGKVLMPSERNRCSEWSYKACQTWEMG